MLRSGLRHVDHTYTVLLGQILTEPEDPLGLLRQDRLGPGARCHWLSRAARYHLLDIWSELKFDLTFGLRLDQSP
jgi:hypothetical protein